MPAPAVDAGRGRPRPGHRAAPLHRRADRGPGVAPGAATGSASNGLTALIDDLAAGGPGAARPCSTGCWPRRPARNGGPLTDDVALCLVSIPARRRMAPDVTDEAGRSRRAGRCAPASPPLLGAGRASSSSATLGDPARAPGPPARRPQRPAGRASTRPGSPSANLRAAVVDQETGVRGYALTRDERVPRAVRAGRGRGRRRRSPTCERLPGDDALADDVAASRRP